MKNCPDCKDRSPENYHDADCSLVDGKPTFRGEIQADSGLKNYVLVNKPYDGGPEVFGPYSFAEADALLRAGASICGTYKPNCGYWSKLPCWWIDDSNVFIMRELRNPMNAEVILVACGYSC